MFTSDILLHGKHAQYSKELSADDLGLFKRNLDVFMNGAIVGLIYGQKEERDRVSQFKDIQTSILADAVIREKINLDYIYRLIMILDDSGNITIDEKINRAFRDDVNKDISERHQENLKLFMSYSLGGISILYDKIIREGIEIEDFMKNAYNFMQSRNEEINEGMADKLIDDLEKRA